MRLIAEALAALAAIYLLAGAGLAVFQRRLQYFPDTRLTQLKSTGLSGGEELRLSTGDGETLVAWHFQPRAAQPLILYFHGNGGALAWRAERFRMLVAEGAGLLALSYRGYGGSTGAPSEAGLRLDADALYRFALERYSQQHLVLWGESLGTGLAVPLAAAVGVLVRFALRRYLESPLYTGTDRPQDRVEASRVELG